jgi:hypothetical protein
LKCNSTFLSVFEEKKAHTPNKEESVAERLGTEIENLEALLTDSGMYIFKLYTNGHSYDTSVVWVYKKSFSSFIFLCI